MKYILLMQNIMPWQNPMRRPLEMCHGKSKTSSGTIFSTMGKATNWILLNLLELSEYLVKTIVVNLASLIVYYIQFIITLLKIFEKTTTSSMSTKIKALRWWRLRLVIKLTRFQGNRISTLRNLKASLRMRQKPM